MSTNKTENYHLHAWEAGDDFLRSEINENFAAIDGILPFNKKLRIAAGSYLGDDKSGRVIEVGFRPKAVVVTAKANTTCPMSGICTENVETYGLAVSDGGFAVSGYFNNSHTSTGGYISGASLNPYGYIAFGWEE